MENTKTHFKKTFFTIIALAIIGSVLSGSTVLAVPPDNKYAPGDTLTPNCLPGSTNCSVTPLASSGANANITSLSALSTTTWSTGAAITAGSYQIGRDADATNQLHFNVPTGAGYEWSVNDVALITSTATSPLTITQVAGTSGVPKALTITGAAHTGLTAAIEDIGIDFDMDATKTWASGAGPLANQREIYVRGPTYAGTGTALTITDATSLYVEPPVQGASMTLTNIWAIKTTGRINVPNGTAALPSLTIGTADLTTGFYGTGTAGQIAFASSGNLIAKFDENVATRGLVIESNVTNSSNNTQLAITATNSLNTGDAIIGVPDGTVRWGIGVYGAIRALSPSLSPLSNTTRISLGISTALTAGVTINQTAISGGAVGFLYTPAAHTAVIAEVIDFSIPAHTMTTTGAITTQRFTTFGIPTITSASALTTTTAATVAIDATPNPTGAGPQTITNAFGLMLGSALATVPAYSASNATTIDSAAMLYIAGAPATGGNVTVTNPWALWADDGAVRLDGQLTVQSGGVKPSAFNAVSSTWTNAVFGNGTGRQNITIYSGAGGGNSGDINFADSAVNTNPGQYAGFISYDHGDTMNFGVASAQRQILTSTRVYWTNFTTTNAQPISTFALTVPSHTAMPVGGEISQVLWTLGNYQWATGALTTERFYQITGPTISFVGASTVTNAISFSVNAAPAAGTNATITNAYAARFGGAVTIGATTAGMTYGVIDVPAHTVTVTGSTQVTSSPGVAGIRIGQITATDGSSLTIDNGASLYIANAPTIDGSVTITNAYALWIDAGSARFDGRVLGTQGADIASANDLTLGADGNVFEITGTTQINAITTSGWQNGARVTLLFTSIPLVKHNTAGGAGTAVILMGNAGLDRGMTAGDSLTLVLSEIGGTQAWREIGFAAI